MEPICNAYTAQGKKCRRCIAKYGVDFCWQHSEMPPTKLQSFVKSVRSKKSPKISPKKELDVEYMPKEVLYEILLKLPRKELHYMCTTSSKVAKICKEPRFRQEYNKINVRSTFFVGKLRNVGIRKEDPRCTKGYWGLDDKIGNTLNLRNDGKGISYIAYRSLRAFSNIDIEIFRRRGKWQIHIQSLNKYYSHQTDEVIEEIRSFLEYMGKEEWMPVYDKKTKNYTGSDESAKEFLKIINNEISKIWGKIPKC